MRRDGDGGAQAFEQVLDLVERAARGLLRHVNKENKNNVLE
jgi:hypothetical protein